MRYLMFLLTWFLIISAARAEDIANLKTEENLEVELNGFGVPAKAIKTIINETPAPVITDNKVMPECGDEELQSRVRKIIADAQEKQSGKNIYDRRKQILIVKNTAQFKEVDLNTFQPADDYNVANHIIDYKINDQEVLENMRLCVGENPFMDDKLYLLMHPKDGKLQIDILNFNSPDVENRDLYFVYQ